MTSRRLIAVLAVLVCAACSAHHPGPRPTVTGAAGPKTVQQLCDAQTWPRPVPNVVGRLLYQAKDGTLECYQLKTVAPDGHDPLNHPARPAEKTYRIVAVSPATGTPVGRRDAVTVELAEVDPTEPPAFRPCDWVTATEAAGIMGGPVNAEPLGAEPGSVDIACISTSHTTSGMVWKSTCRPRARSPSTRHPSSHRHRHRRRGRRHRPQSLLRQRTDHHTAVHHAGGLAEWRADTPGHPGVWIVYKTGTLAQLAIGRIG